MIKILFICHGSIIKCSEKACKINDFGVERGAYYTTTTPFLKEPWNDNKMIANRFWWLYEMLFVLQSPFLNKTENAFA